MGRINALKLPVFTPPSILTLLSSGSIDSAPNLRRQLKRGGFKNELSTNSNSINDYSVNEFDFTRMLTFETNESHFIRNEWYNIVLTSPTGLLYYISFLRECGERYIPSGILRNGEKTIDRCDNSNEITMHVSRIKKNNLNNIKGKTVLTVNANSFVFPCEIT